MSTRITCHSDPRHGTAVMAVQYSRLSLLILVIILMISLLSSCCEAARWMSKEIEQTEKSSFSHQFSVSWHFYTKTQVVPNTEDAHPIYGVSLRDVPGGPNPLHN
ncbi:hypothetical protein VNO78_10412 [Psophocarpus tetragonolobus]|uniref:Uncharacterized protein n=1 Tax=Psophocarpus tetragonolobus TaxID=3891 RepID=A0AAN9XM83_PSOTE